MPRIVVGVDAGGTSTIAAVAQDGQLLRTRSGEAANASVRGVEAASEVIAQTIAAALDGAIPAAVFVGAAGAGRPDIAQSIMQTLEERFPGASVRVADDAHIALRAAVPSGDGLVLIAGTGSLAYAEHRGVEYRSGGYGYLLGDEGSGFAIGSAALRLLLRAFDELAPHDEFTHALAAQLDAGGAFDVLAAVYGNAHPVAVIASLAPVVVQSANDGQRGAAKIVQQAAQDLAQTAGSLAKRSQLAQTESPIVLAGGLLQENSLLTYLLETRLRNEFPSMPILKGAPEPYLGALAQAEQL